jgi:hypothetical protein
MEKHNTLTFQVMVSNALAEVSPTQDMGAKRLALPRGVRLSRSPAAWAP